MAINGKFDGKLTVYRNCGGQYSRQGQGVTRDRQRQDRGKNRNKHINQSETNGVEYIRDGKTNGEVKKNENKKNDETTAGRISRQENNIKKRDDS